MDASLIYITDGYPFVPEDLFSGDDLTFLMAQPWNVHVLPRGKLKHVAFEQDLGYSVDPCLMAPDEKKITFLVDWRALPLICREVRNSLKHGITPRPISLFKGVAVALQARAALRQFILRENLHQKPLLIYAFWFSPVVVGAWLLRREFPHMKLVSRLHRVDLYAFRARGGYLPFRFWRAGMADVFAPCSQQGVEYLKEEGVPSDILTCRYLGVPVAPGIAPATPEGQLHVMSCSFARPVKRLPLLARSFLALSQHRPDLKISWHHVGDGPELEEIKILMRTPPPNLVCIFHGAMNVEESRQFFQGDKAGGLDGLINVSESEGLPVSMMEAHMAGLPVVGTDVGGVSEIVRPDTGILLPKNFSQEQFDAAVLALRGWKGLETRAHIAQQARDMFSLENYKKFIDEVLWPQMRLSQCLLEQRHREAPK